MKKQAKASDAKDAQEIASEGFSLPVGTPRAPRVPKLRDEGIRRLKLLFTVVDRSKANFYLDMLEQYEVNFQTVIYGSGTAEAARFGAVESDKALLLSVVREDMVAPALHMLEEKFARVKNGKGIAFTVPFGSVIGVQNYCFLSNSSTKSK
ncbi:MAG: hypothetical protein E7609_02610 [Ruminococcaceae bacterium]|nr:hypothetical protein [Oscillospiraceae bacterium]